MAVIVSVLLGFIKFSCLVVVDYEDQIQQREQDMDQQTQLVAELDSEVKRLQVIIDGRSIGYR